MKLKVCGMKYANNIARVAELKPDYLGFIFYPHSKRYCAKEITPKILSAIDPEIKKVAVFVNENLQKIMQVVNEYEFSIIQLHGNEAPELCAALKNENLTIIKVFSVDSSLPDNLMEYAQCADFFLFDTKTPDYGGSGNRFDWSVLKDYNLSKPIFLSGGISPDSIEDIKELNDLPVHAVDINSRFELSPGIKEVDKIKAFKSKLAAINGRI